MKTIYFYENLSTNNELRQNYQSYYSEWHRFKHGYINNHSNYNGYLFSFSTL